MSPHAPMWRSTPPALFPPLLGAMGLALAWRHAAQIYGTLDVIGDLLLGAAAAIYLCCLGAYLAKLIARPGAVIEDLRTLPGRAGLPAATMSGMLIAAGLVPVLPKLAAGLFFTALGAHGLVMALVIGVLLTGPAAQRRVTPVWHLTFVGAIVAPLAAVPLGFDGLARIVTLATMGTATLIYVASLFQASGPTMPAPLRPVLAIHLAPVSLIGTAAALLGMDGAALGFGVVGLIGLVVLVGTARWLTVAGFSPLWGAFTFPLAALTGLALMLSPESRIFAGLGAGGLAAATVIIPWITTRVLRMWPNGTLGAKTNAAVA